MKMGHGKDNDDHEDESPENTGSDEEASFQMNRTNLILPEKFYGTDVTGPSSIRKSYGSPRVSDYINNTPRKWSRNFILGLLDSQICNLNSA